MKITTDQSDMLVIYADMPSKQMSYLVNLWMIRMSSDVNLLTK